MKHADDQIQQGDDAKLETVVQERERYVSETLADEAHEVADTLEKRTMSFCSRFS